MKSIKGGIKTQNDVLNGNKWRVKTHLSYIYIHIQQQLHTRSSISGLVSFMGMNSSFLCVTLKVHILRAGG